MDTGKIGLILALIFFGLLYWRGVVVSRREEKLVQIIEEKLRQKKEEQK